MEKFFDLIIAITTGEKSALPVLRTMIDVLSIIVLANYLFKWSFADYELVNIYDYNSMVYYFLNGEFIFLIIFLLFSYTLVSYIKTFVFGHLEDIFRSNFEDKIIKHQYYKGEIANNKVEPSADGEHNLLVTTLLKILIIIHNVIVEVRENRQDGHKQTDEWNKIRKSKKLNKPLDDYRKSIELSLKSLITLFLLIVFLKFSLANFPMMLFVASILFLVSTIILYLIVYRLIIVVPKAIDELQKQKEEFLKI